MSSNVDDVTQLLLDWQGGDQGALDQLVSRVYDELHKRARRYLRAEHRGHTLQATALINEVYLRLVDQRRVHWQNRAQFFGVASQMMRRILVDHARRRRAARRGGDPILEPLVESVPAPQLGEDVLALDEALTRLATFAPRQSRVVELRTFGGLTIAETARVLGVSAPTVKLDWSMARAWLYRQLQGSREGD